MTLTFVIICLNQIVGTFVNFSLMLLLLAIDTGKALQVEQMRNAGLIKGGSVENAIVCRYMHHSCLSDSHSFTYTGHCPTYFVGNLHLPALNYTSSPSIAF